MTFTFEPYFATGQFVIRIGDRKPHGYRALDLRQVKLALDHYYGDQRHRERDGHTVGAQAICPLCRGA